MRSTLTTRMTRMSWMTLVTLSAIAGAAGAATWNPNQGAAVPGDGVYIGKVTKHVSNHSGDRVTTYYVANESGALEIKPGELSPGQLAALEAAWGQNDNDNFAKVADGRVTDVGTGGPYPSQAH